MGGRMRNLWRPLLSVQPSRALVDEEFSVRVQNAPPAQRLTVHALLHSEDGDDWEAFGHYVTDAGGDVNVTKDPSLGGTYGGVEPMGLLWSLRPAPGSRPGLRFRKRDIQTPMPVRLSVYQGHQSEGFMDRAVLASVMVESWYMAPGVRRVAITKGGVTASLFLPPGPGPFPGLLDLWGGSTGLVDLLDRPAGHEQQNIPEKTLHSLIILFVILSRKKMVLTFKFLQIT